MALEVPGGRAPIAVQPEPANLKLATGVTDAWIKSVQAQPAEKQVEEVVKKLKELNPGWDGKVWSGVANGRLTRLESVGMGARNLSDISPLRALNDLDYVKFAHSKIVDLSPLRGSPMRVLSIPEGAVSDLAPLAGRPLQTLFIFGTSVRDLSPLKGMPLILLACEKTQVTDMSPVKDCPLKELSCDFVPERDAAILRSIRTLEKINGMPAADFWKKVDTELAAKAAAGNVDDPERWKDAIDLLALVDAKKDTIAGKCEIKNNALECDWRHHCKTELPYSPPAEYEYRVVFSKGAGTRLAQILVKSGHPFTWDLGLDGNRPGFGALASRMPGGLPPNPELSLVNDRKHVSLVQVRKDGVAALVDSRLVCEWKSDQGQIDTLWFWNLTTPNVLGIGTHFIPVTFYEIQVLEISGKGTFIRSDDPAAKKAKKKQDEVWAKREKTGAAQPDAGTERPWKPIFDGKTLECLNAQGRGEWRVDNGALARGPGAWESPQTVFKFRDGDVRIRFEVAQGENLQFKIRQGNDGHNMVAWFGPEQIARLGGKTRELVFSCCGDQVKAALDGQPVEVKTSGQPRSGCIQFYKRGGTLRILSIEYRELAPERLEVGQKDKDGWTYIFNGRDLTGWDGKATVEDGAIVVQKDTGATCRTQGPDFELRGSVKPVLGRTFCGFLAFRLGDDSRPRLLFCPDGDVDLWEAGAARTTHSGPGRVPVGAWCSFILRVVGSSLTVQVGDKPILQGTVAHQHGSGLNLAAWGEGEKTILFKDLWLRELGPDGKPLGAAQPDAGALPKELSLDLGGGVKMEMVLVPAGEFMMGSNDGPAEEKPVRKVRVSKPFYMAKYETTVAQFRAFADATKHVTAAEKCGKGWTWKDGKWQEVGGVNWRTPGFPQEDNYPACVITWNDAQEFMKWAGKKTGRNVCLPTEAQWEYACRAGTKTKFCTGDKDSDLEEAAWFNKNSGMHANACGQKKANAWGLYDMHGNVWEWVQDYFNDKYYQESPAVDPKGPATGGDRVLRGGCWLHGPDGCRAARRFRDHPGSRGAYTGFRCAVEVAPTP